MLLAKKKVVDPDEAFALSIPEPDEAERTILDPGTLFWSTLYLLATGVLLLFAAHEGGKCVTCWHRVQESLTPANEYTEKPLCNDIYEISRYGQFSEEGCTRARETVQLGEYGGVVACYWRNSLIHSVFTVQDVRVTGIIVSIVLCSLYWALKEYRQHQTEKETIASNERLAARMHAQVLQLHRRSEKTRGLPLSSYLR